MTLTAKVAEMDAEILERLDHLIALYELVNGEALRKARAEARSDDVTSTVLEMAADWIGAGALKAAVAAKEGTSEKTVQRRILDLAAQKALASRGYAATLQYRSTGLI